MAYIYVRGTNGLNTNSGADWDNARQTVTSALSIVTSGDIILVDNAESFTAGAAITYTPPANLSQYSIMSALRSGTTGFTKQLGVASTTLYVNPVITLA